MTERLDVVSGLYFGRDDAEHDAVDGLLNAGFLATAAFEETLLGRKSLVIGRKGSGKSAICMRLTMPEVTQGHHVLITPDDAAGNQLRRFELDDLTDEVAKSLIWRYVFAIHIARHLVAAHARGVHGTSEPKSVRQVRKFLRGNGQLADQRLQNRITTAIGGLSGTLSLEAFGVSLSADLKSAPQGIRAAEQLAIIERGVAQAVADLGCADTHQPLLLLVDKLEHVWSAERSSEALVTGLLLASKHVARTYPRAARCVLFIRSDIYDALTFSEADKFHSDEIRIDWSREKLVELAIARAAASLGDHVTGDYLWGTVFPGQMGNENVVDYLFSRMLPRPRDAIQFLNLCRDTAHANRHDRITEFDVAEAMLGFSRWKTLDLAREYRSTIPYLERVLAFFQNGGYRIDRATIGRHLESFGGTLRDEFPQARDVLTPHGLLDVLFRVGFVGVRRGGQITYVTNAALPIQPGEDEFHIHPCFRPALNLVAAIVVNGSVYGGLVVGAYNTVQAVTISGDVHFGNILGPDSVPAPRRDRATQDPEPDTPPEPD
jgi:hypothetical protein